MLSRPTGGLPNDRPHAVARGVLRPAPLPGRAGLGPGRSDHLRDASVAEEEPRRAHGRQEERRRLRGRLRLPRHRLRNGTGDRVQQGGKLLRVLNLHGVDGSSPALLGLDFHPTTHALLVIDFGAQQVLNVDPMTGTSTLFTKLSPKAGPNALTFDAAGNVYVSDSFQGVIWKTAATGGAATAWASSPLLTTTGDPPFGANGIAFNNARTAMFVANTGDDTIIKIPVLAGGAAGSPEVFTNSINGADGLIIDEQDNIWVCANQADEIVVVDKTGKAIAKLGDFDGIGERGEPRGFLFPASLAFSGEFLLVTNLSLDLRLFDTLGTPTKQSVDSAWAAQVKTHTVAKIKRRIPPVHDD